MTPPDVPSPAPVNTDSFSLDLAFTSTLLSNPAPPPSAGAITTSLDINCPRQAQTLVENVGLDAAALLCPHNGDFFLHMPRFCAVVLQFTP